MSWRYSSWRWLRSPNIRSSSTLEKPITAFSGVRSSWDMLARNSDLCRLAPPAPRTRTSSSRNSRGVQDGQGRLAGERLEQLQRCHGEKLPVVLRRMAPGAPTIWSWRGASAPPAPTATRRRTGSGRCGSRGAVGREVGHPRGGDPVQGSPADERGSSRRILMPAEPFEQTRSLLPNALRTSKQSSCSSYSMMGAAVGAGEAYGVWRRSARAPPGG